MEQQMEKKLFVGNLSWGVSDEQLKEAFSKFGEIKEATIIKDRETQRSRGFGFVTFQDSEEKSASDATAEAIEAMHGTEFEGREDLVVNEARPSKPREEGNQY